VRLVEDEKGTDSDKGESMKAADILIAEVLGPVSPISEETFDTACITQTFGRELSGKGESNEVRIQLW
jgi:hypothetical protein